MLSHRRERPLPRLPRGLTAALVLGASACGVLLAMPALAAPPVAVGVRAGTTGLGADVTIGASDHAHLRLAASRFGFDTTITADGIDYDTEAEVGAALLLLDWYPSGGAFRLSVGGGWNGTEADVSAPLEDLLRAEVPGLPPLPIDIGTASGTARGDDLVPIVLLGWGNPFRGGRWNVSFEVGAFYQGEPEVDLHVDTTLPVGSIPGGQAALDAAIAQEERALEEELRDYTVVPVVSFTVSYRFGAR